MRDATEVKWFVVRTEGRWSLAPVPGTDLIPADLDAVLEVLGDAPLEPPVAGALGSGTSGVRPTWAWVGAISDGVVEVEDASGNLLRLDRHDLAILDAVTAPVSLGALQGVDVPDLDARLARMLRSGRVLAAAEVQESAPEGAAPADVVAEPQVGTQAELRVGPLPESPSSVADDGRIPVYSVWPEDVGPMLSLGMLTAAARHHRDGALTTHFDIHRPEVASTVLDHLARRSGPALLLCSDYIWSLQHNLDVARRARELNPEVLIVHGGPSCPKYEDDAAAFLARYHLEADILVRGEGELTFIDLLEHLAAHGGRVDRTSLESVAGITFRDPETSEAVRTEDRPRLADLDSLPSPYLTGEFDGLPADAWVYTLSIETNRGCPYGCTFCDWGSATMSRIRKFSWERVAAELEWAAALGAQTVTITDANFGIMSRDVDIAAKVAELRHATGYPRSITWTAAKNTTKHLVRIMDQLASSGIAISTSLSLQSTDADTLDAIDRQNISTDHYVKLAADYRRRGYPLQGDLMLGLPGQTFESYKADLQFMLDHEVMVRTWPVQLLPNSPMNDPEYRRLHQLEVDDDNLVTSAASFSAEDRRRMWRFRNVDTISERLAVLRHLVRYLQWDHGIRATDVMERVLDLVDAEPRRYPVMSWVFSYFDLVPTVAIGWGRFYAEVRDFVIAEYGLDPDDPGLRTVLEVQRMLMPIPGRTFPQTAVLDHDYVSYYRSAARTLYTHGRASRPVGRLTDHGPATFEVTGDPIGLCEQGIHLQGDSRSEVMQGDFHVGAITANELESDLIRVLPALSLHGIHPVSDWYRVDGDDTIDGFVGDDEDEETEARASVVVALSGRHRDG